MSAPEIDRDELRRRATAMIDDLRSSGQVTGLAIGDIAPAFTLPSATGKWVSLGDRLAAGPAVVVFYRGAWCPVCNVHLRALQAALPEITSHDARLIAISPQAPDASLELAEKLALGFDVLSDVDQAVARQWGLQFELPEDLRDMYRAMGMALDGHNADGSWNLPVPATFVVDGAGVVRARHVDPDYRQRMTAEEIVAALAAIAAAG